MNLENTPDSGTDVSPGVPLLRNPAQTIAWVLLRKPVIIGLSVLLGLVLVIVLVTRGVGGEASSRMVAGVKVAPRTPAARLVRDTPDKPEGESPGSRETPNPDRDRDDSDPGSDRDRGERENERDSDDDPDRDHERDSDDDSDRDSDNDSDHDDSDHDDSDDDNNPDSNDSETPTPTPEPTPENDNDPTQPTQEPAPASPPSNTVSTNPQQVTPGLKTATVTKNIHCQPQASIRIEAIGTGQLTLQAGEQSTSGTGKIILTTSGTDFTITATSQAPTRAFIQFAWQWTQGGYCTQQ